MALSDESRAKIVKAIKTKSRNKEVEIRQRAAKLLVYLKELSEEMIETYIDTVLNGSSASDRDVAAKALVMVGEPSVQPVIDQLVGADDNEYAVLIGMEILTNIAVKDQNEKEAAEAKAKGKESGEGCNEEECSGCPGCQ